MKKKIKNVKPMLRKCIYKSSNTVPKNCVNTYLFSVNIKYVMSVYLLINHNISKLNQLIL